MMEERAILSEKYEDQLKTIEWVKKEKEKIDKAKEKEKNMTIKGYVELYMKIEIELDGNKHMIYTNFNSDFHEPITEEKLKVFLDIEKQVIEKLNMKVLSIDYCTKEEYYDNDYENTSFSCDIDFF